MTLVAAEASLHGLRFEVAAFSERGPRSENQDAFAIDDFSHGGLLALADGMGGEKGGRTAAEHALRALTECTPIHTLEGARRAVRHADRRVVEAAAADPAAHEGMGCALALISLSERNGAGAGWVGAHVGDVRILSLSPDGLLRLETRDHTPAFARWEAGEITLDEVPDSPGANRLQRAVGRGGEADVLWLPAGPGWCWLIVSDGVYKAMRLDELAHALRETSARESCEAIRRKVAERGADDNFTAVVVRALGPVAASAPAAAPGEGMNRTNPTPPRRSPASAFAAALALTALVIAGLALWTAREARLDGVRRVEMEVLRQELDSLRARLIQLGDPFGPAEPPSPGIEPASPGTDPAAGGDP